VVKGWNDGIASIVATAQSLSDTAIISVHAVVTSVSVSGSRDSIAVRDALQLVATLRSGTGALVFGRTVTWSSLDPAVATVSQGGLVTGVSPGPVVSNCGSDPGSPR
jgi:uncharacterized protein YjdB